MKLRSIETTPNPNCMKLNLDGFEAPHPLTLSDASDTSSNLPGPLRALLTIEGVTSLFAVKHFVTLTRSPRARWEHILPAIAQHLDASHDVLAAATAPAPEPVPTTLGEVDVFVQRFRGVPVQVRVQGADSQARVALGPRFKTALDDALARSGGDYLRERAWVPLEGTRVGQPEEVAHMVADELSSISDAALDDLVEHAVHGDEATSGSDVGDDQQALLEALNDEDWRVRLRTLQTLTVTDETVRAVLAKLEDPRGAVRRWAASALGTSNRHDAVDALIQRLLEDTSVAVRRTVGDALSDLADPRAIPAMCQALGDDSKLVRWRAARFLNDVGDAQAIDALEHAASEESELEVKMEMLAAVERIQGGTPGQKPMWMRIAHAQIND